MTGTLDLERGTGLYTGESSSNISEIVLLRELRIKYV